MDALETQALGQHERRRSLTIAWATRRAAAAWTMAAAVIVLAGPSVAGASGWSKPVHYGPIEGGAHVSCGSQSFCIAIGSESGSAAIYKGGEWSPPVKPDEGNTLQSVSCTPEEFCVAISPTGGVIYENGSWGKPFKIDPAVASGSDLMSVSCKSNQFCLTVGVHGKVFTYKGKGWTGPVEVANERELKSVSCFSTTFCATGGQEGYVSVYNGSTWLSPPASVDTLGSFITSVSCGAQSFCAAADNDGDVLTYAGGVWSKPLHLSGLGSNDEPVVSCPTQSFCGGISNDAHPWWTFNGSSWSTPVALELASAAGLSCTSGTFCLAVSGGSNYSIYSGAAPEFGRCLKQTTKAVSNFDSANCTKLASDDSGTEAEKLTKGNYRWTSGVVKPKFTTVLKSGTLATLESVRGVKITCTGETSSGEYVRTSEMGKLIAKFTGCERSSEKCSSAGRGVGEIETHPLGGALGFETELELPSKDHIAGELHSESGNVMEFSCGGVPFVVRGSLLHKIAANAMKLTATETFTASKGKQKPEHFAGGAAKEHTLEMSTNGEAFEQAGWTWSETLTNEEKVEASTIN